MALPPTCKSRQNHRAPIIALPELFAIYCCHSSVAADTLTKGKSTITASTSSGSRRIRTAPCDFKGFDGRAIGLWGQLQREAEVESEGEENITDHRGQAPCGITAWLFKFQEDLPSATKGHHPLRKLRMENQDCPVL